MEQSGIDKTIAGIKLEVEKALGEDPSETLRERLEVLLQLANEMEELTKRPSPSQAQSRKKRC